MPTLDAVRPAGGGVDVVGRVFGRVHRGGRTPIGLFDVVDVRRAGVDALM